VIPFEVDSAGTTTIDMAGPNQHSKADTSSAAGILEVDPSPLGNSRGEVRIDLATLTTHTFDDADKNATQTKHARGASGDSVPRALEIKTRRPMRLVLKEHDIVPRDPVGAALQWTATLVSKVAETAEASVDLTARPSAAAKAATR
jgi:hypothetical protein